MRLTFVLLLPCALAGAPAFAQPAPPTVITDVEASLPAEDWEREALRLLAPATIINPTRMSVARARAGVAARPRDADAWHQLGELLDVAGLGDEAVAAFRRATTLPPRVLGRGYLYRDLAEALERQGDHEGALAAARSAIRGWPLSRDSLYCGSTEAMLMARLLLRTRDPAGAAAFWRTLAVTDPGREQCRRIQQALDGAARR